MPIIVFGKVVLILYADSGRMKVDREPDVASLQEVVGEAQIALQRIVQSVKKDVER
jgi:hypothetical protein